MRQFNEPIHTGFYTMPELKFNNALAAYLGFACGDALGATVEFMRPRQIQQRYGVHTEMIGGGWLGLEAGQVTDDTQLCLTLAQAVLDHGGWNIKAIADYFSVWLDSDPPDVGDTIRRGLNRYRRTGEIFGPERADDAGNGACMRNLPVVLLTLNQPAALIRCSLEHSHITHNHPLSDAATLTWGAMLSRLIQGEGVDACRLEAERLLSRHPEFTYAPYPGKASAYIVDTIQTVLHYFFSTDSFESCLIATVNQGDDADTTGALVGMLAGARYGLEQIPERWLSRLDSEVVGRIHAQTRELLKLGDELGV
jgi:ADP-ribosyl-[dinitrogen reductase] hydrolase